MIRLLLVALLGLLPLMAADTPEPQMSCGVVPVKLFKSWGVPTPPMKLGGLYHCMVYRLPADVVAIKVVVRYESAGKIWTVSGMGEAKETGAFVSLDVPEDIRVLSRDVHFLGLKHTVSADH